MFHQSADISAPEGWTKFCHHSWSNPNLEIKPPVAPTVGCDERSTYCATPDPVPSHINVVLLFTTALNDGCDPIADYTGEPNPERWGGKHEYSPVTTIPVLGFEALWRAGRPNTFCVHLAKKYI